MTHHIQQLDAAVRAYHQGDASPFAELVASKFTAEEREVVRSIIVSPPKRQRPASPRVRRVADAAADVLNLIDQGVTPNAAMKAVLACYPDIAESVLDNAAIKKTRGDVAAELERRGLHRTKKRQKLNLETLE